MTNPLTRRQSAHRRFLLHDKRRTENGYINEKRDSMESRFSFMYNTIHFHIMRFNRKFPDNLLIITYTYLQPPELLL